MNYSPLATSHSPFSRAKNGISLIAVLMFMLAATTASIVIFKWIGSENFSSGARLKASEAYQASQSGLDAVQAWLSNKALDVGALISLYEGKKEPIYIPFGVLGQITCGEGCKQNYKVYLIGIDTAGPRLKFMSVGRARDSSKISQTAIFSAGGLYKVNAKSQKPKKDCDIDFEYAFFGGFSSNTQGKFSSAVLNVPNNGDIEINGITTTGNLIATGNLSFLDNGENKIGCTNERDSTGNIKKQGDLYVTGDFNPRGFAICGNAFVGGNIPTVTSKPLFKKDLFVVGNIQKVTFAVMGNMTVGDTISSPERDGMFVQGNLVLTDVYDLVTWGKSKPTAAGIRYGNFMVTDDLFSNGGSGDYGGSSTYAQKIANFDGLTVNGSFWTHDKFRGKNNNADRMNFAKVSGNVYVPSARNVNGNAWRSQNYNNTDSVNFNSFSNATPKVSEPNTQNKPRGANNLEDLANEVKECKRKGREELCVPDPLELPEVTKERWIAAANKLTEMANPTKASDTTILKNISNACLRLLKDNNANENNDNRAGWYGCGYASKTDFTNNVNRCYADLKNHNGGVLLYGEGNDQFLAVNLKGCQGAESGQFDGKFIFVFQDQITDEMKLGETTKDAAVFMYFNQGVNANMAMTGSKNDGKYRNYFIFSEGDIKSWSGTTKITGAVFLANGASSGPFPDTDVIFNKDLFRSLVEAGIITKAGDPDPKCFDEPIKVEDDIWISASNKLSVKLESKEISKESEPGEKPELEPSILVMPRVVRLPSGQTISKNELGKYYEYIPLNGANQPTKPNLNSDLNCNKKEENVYECTFKSTTPPISPFQVIGTVNN